MNYEDILVTKTRCHEIIKQFLGDKYLELMKYYKGDLLPFINTKCRKNMTCGDIDCIQWDFNKKILRIIENKRTLEKSKDSQSKLLEFLTAIKIPEYEIQVIKTIGDPPFETTLVIDIKNNTTKQLNQQELISYLNLE